MNEIILAIIVVLILLLILVCLFLFTIKRVNILVKKIFVDKLQEYDFLIEDKEKKVEELNKDIWNDVEKFYSSLDTFEFKNVTFSYGNDDVLEDTSLSLKKGDFAAITGISGIGKSTMMKMMLGVLHPSEGTVHFNTENGEFVPGKKYCNLFSYVPQGNAIFSGTVADNLRIVRPEATEYR